MPVSGVLLTRRENAVEAVRQAVVARPRHEVRDGAGPMLVIITDTESLDDDRAEVDWLATLPGVLSTFVAFSNVEDLTETANAAGGSR